MVFSIAIPWAANNAAHAGIGESNVLVLYNADDGPDGAGFQIAKHYQQVHPGAHLLGIHGVNSYFSGVDTQAITAAQYLDSGDGTPGSGGIRRQILDGIAGIESSIDVLVTTKGLPLKIDAGVQPADYDTYRWRRFSSLESELTRIDSIDSSVKMGDQYCLYGFPQYDQTLPSNPYYLTNGQFVRAGSDPVHADIRLTSRLDGHSVETVIASIDRAQRAFLAPLPGGPMVVADDDPSASIDQIEDYWAGPGPGLLNVLNTWQGAAEQRLAEALGQPGYQFATSFAQHNNTAEAITTAPGQVIGYVSHGVHGSGLESGYTRGQLQFQLANGAVFQSHESYNAFSFDASHTQSQGLISEWLEMGGTAGLGHVAEPYNGPDNVTNEDLLYQMLLPSPLGAPASSGLTFVEAAWNATRQLSYVNTVVGDPLMRFYLALPGDINLDGTVDDKDVAILQANWLQPGAFPQGDLNGDLVVNELDLEIVQSLWLLQIDRGAVGLSPLKIPKPIIDPHTGYPVIPAIRIPEPGSAMLGLILMAVAALLRLRRGGHR